MTTTAACLRYVKNPMNRDAKIHHCLIHSFENLLILLNRDEGIIV
jgi:hypothetical protein